MTFDDPEDLEDIICSALDSDWCHVADIVDDLKDGYNNDFFCYSAVESGYKEPKTYKQMLKSPEEEKRH